MVVHEIEEIVRGSLGDIPMRVLQYDEAKLDIVLGALDGLDGLPVHEYLVDRGTGHAYHCSDSRRPVELTRATARAVVLAVNDGRHWLFALVYVVV